MLKKLMLTSLALTFILGLAGCDRNRDADMMKQDEANTSPHSMESRPTNTDELNSDQLNNDQLHDDYNNGASTPAFLENDASGVVPENSGSSLSSRTRPD